MEATKTSFSPKSIGKEQDRFHYYRYAKSEAAKLIKNDSFVSLAIVDGGLGEGKSSYARMLVEAIKEKTEILYTYISLNETNDEDDFANLFAKRWFETLKQKYPIITLDDSYLLKSILRTKDNFFIRLLLHALSFLSNFKRIKIKCCDKGISEQEKSITRSIAKAFSFIPEIKEDLWIIMIEDLERETIDEIYKLKEIIERFRHEGRLGMPIKLFFIIPTSLSELQKFINYYKKSEQKFYLIEDYLSKSSRVIDHRICLPIVDKDAMSKYIITNVATKYLNNKEEKEVFKRDFFQTINRDTFLLGSYPPYSEKYFYAFIVNYLCDTSLRSILNLEKQVIANCNKIVDADGIEVCRKIAICDIVLFSLIQNEAPYLIEYFRKITSGEVAKKFNPKHEEEIAWELLISDLQEIKPLEEEDIVFVKKVFKLIAPEIFNEFFMGRFHKLVRDPECRDPWKYVDQNGNRLFLIENMFIMFDYKNKRQYKNLKYQEIINSPNPENEIKNLPTFPNSEGIGLENLVFGFISTLRIKDEAKLSKLTLCSLKEFCRRATSYPGAPYITSDGFQNYIDFFLELVESKAFIKKEHNDKITEYLKDIFESPNLSIERKKDYLSQIKESSVIEESTINELSDYITKAKPSH